MMIKLKTELLDYSFTQNQIHITATSDTSRWGVLKPRWIIQYKEPPQTRIQQCRCPRVKQSHSHSLCGCNWLWLISKELFFFQTTSNELHRLLLTFNPSLIPPEKSIMTLFCFKPINRPSERRDERRRESMSENDKFLMRCQLRLDSSLGQLRAAGGGEHAVWDREVARHSPD